jgi:hypothetical protein
MTHLMNDRTLNGEYLIRQNTSISIQIQKNILRAYHFGVSSIHRSTPKRFAQINKIGPTRIDVCVVTAKTNIWCDRMRLRYDVKLISKTILENAHLCLHPQSNLMLASFNLALIAWYPGFSSARRLVL